MSDEVADARPVEYEYMVAWSEGGTRDERYDKLMLQLNALGLQGWTVYQHEWMVSGDGRFSAEIFARREKRMVARNAATNTRASSEEIATRLATALWHSEPDEALLKDARRNRLAVSEEPGKAVLRPPTIVVEDAPTSGPNEAADPTVHAECDLTAGKVVFKGAGAEGTE